MIRVVVRNNKHEKQFPEQDQIWKLVAYCGQLIVAEIAPFKNKPNGQLKYRLFCHRYNPSSPTNTLQFLPFNTVSEALTAMWDMLKNPVPEQEEE